MATEEKVLCPVPDCGKMYKPGHAMMMHLTQPNGHNLPYEGDEITGHPEYKEVAWWRKPTEDEKKKKFETKPDTPPSEPLAEAGDLAEQALSRLTPPERQYFDELFGIIFQQVDRDPALVGDITSLCLCNVDLLVFREKYREKFEATEYSKAKYYGDAIKQLEDQKLKLMASLGISRVEKQKNKTQIKSSPAALIAGFENEIEMMSPEALEKMVIEERNALAEMSERVKKYLLDKAPTIEPVSEENNGPTLDIEAIIRDADIPF